MDDSVQGGPKMKRTRMLAALAGAALVLTPALATAQQSVDVGRREFESNCAVCHGATGKGDGPYMTYMNFKAKGVGDLTLIARRNGGTFPFQRIYEVIDGTAELAVHGPRDMPIWGRDYLRQAADAYRDYEGPYNASMYVRSRILALIDYLNRIQVK
jgi:mono/diheme cytochrome c family protein